MDKEKMEEYVRAQKEAQQKAAAVPHKVLVMSGKGGVGKTTVAVNLAFALAEQGFDVGILDTDLHGPNAAFMAGVEGQGVYSTAKGVLEPLRAAKGVRVLSISGFLPSRDTPVIWRGPRKSGAIQQLLGEGDWKGVDVLVVDCPPGTGDEPMSVAQLIPDADGVVVVTTPQEVSLLDSRKCVNFVREIHLDVLGIVENMSSFICSECGHRTELFKSGGGEKAAAQMQVPFLGKVPLTEAVVTSGDEGKPLVVDCPDDPAAKALLSIAGELKKHFEAKKGAGKEGASSSTQSKEGGTKRLVAVAANGSEGLEAEVSAHFGRCPFYVVAEIEGGEIKKVRAEKNPHFESHSPGQVPKFVKELDADVILTGGMGRKAQQLFEKLGVEIGCGASGTVRDAIKAFLAGELSSQAGCSHDHPSSCGHGH
jgi:Mrp family chromosome partitioning ATPase/predicted Fe-Mo cluster-binding NifX family protein